MSYLLYALAGYLSGSVLYSYEIPKVFCGIDICARGKDHNPGAANVFRYAGPLPGTVCVALDLLKGFLPVAIAVQRLTPDSPWFGLVLAAPVLGHAYPLYYGLRGGGKAIAVSFGALLGLLPDLTPALILAIYYLFFLWWRLSIRIFTARLSHLLCLALQLRYGLLLRLTPSAVC